MLFKPSTIVPILLVLWVSNIRAQQWSANLPPGSAKELSFQDYKKAFEDYYNQHPVPLEREKLKPTFRFAGTEEVTTRIAIEEYKLFKRWEWLMEPRTYPTGRLDMEAITNTRKMLPQADNQLLMKTAEQNPLNLKFERYIRWDC